MGSLERRERERVQRQRHFVAVARRLFLERGYDGTSIDGVASEAEFSKRTVYLYFADKRELFLAVVLDSLAALHETISRAAGNGESGLDRILSIADAYFRFSQENQEDFQLVLDFETRDYYLHRDTEALGEFAAQCVAVNDRNTELLLDLIGQGQSDGSVRTDARPVELMLMTWAQAVGLIQVMEMRSDRLAEGDYQTSVDKIFRLTLDSLRKSLANA